ncbi:MAG TPA: GAF domain-containing protein, partial [Anaerolineales bacterium]|nr:GAF domain-containing protein [Anaerolineales bacterium]
MRLLQTICSNIGVALENARLFDETQRLLAETRKAKETAETLRSASLAFTESLRLDTILEKLLDYLALMIPYDSATIFLMEDGTHMAARAVRGYERFVDVSLAQRMRIDLENTPPVHRIVEEQSSAVIMDTTQDPSWIWRQTTRHIRSWMGIPLIASGRTIGMYSLDKTEPGFFNEEYLHLAEALAAQAAIVIEKSQLFDSEVVSRARAETQSRRLASLNLVAQAVSSTRNLNEILGIAARQIVSELNARSCGVTLMNADRTQLEVVAFAGQEGVSSTVGIIIPLEGNTGTQRVIASRQSLVLTAEESLRTQSRRANEVFRARGTTCLLITPMLVRDEVIGTFGTDTNDPGRVFTSEEVELAFTIASQISGAIENARLFEETQRLLKLTEERATELTVISKVSQALILESELDNTIQLIGSQISEIFNADIVYVALIDPQTKLIYFPYQVGEEFTVLKYGEGLVSKIIETGEPLLINKNVGDRALELGARPVGKEVLSYLGVPIKTSQSTIGIISVQSTTQEGLFNEDSLRLLTTIAANAGAALHNARLFSEALENLRQVEILTDAARAIEYNVYEPALVESVAAREDALGELARVFRKMADEVRLREQRLKRQLAQLQLDIEEKELAKNETLALYIPMDRRQALAADKTLPEYVHGTALFADVSGFTALTESLTNELGLQRGAEEVTRHLNRVLTTLINEVHRYGGSVISFGGDAITCWFDDLDLNGNPRADTSMERAVASALAMQKGMAQFAAIITPHGKTIAITIKIALSTGPARRMLVGDRVLHQLDVVAGSTLTALEDIEHEVQRGEIVIAAADWRRLAEKFYVAGWHWHGEKRYAVIMGLKKEIVPS